MSRKVMIPFDGTRTSEDVLQVLERWLRCGQVREAIFVRVERPVPSVAVDYPLPEQEVVNANAQLTRDAQRYLETVSREVNWNNVPHRNVVLLGESIPTLARYAEEEDVDVVMIAVEVHHGLSRLLHRSAERVLRAFSVPVLLLGQPVGASDDGGMHKVRTAA